MLANWPVVFESLKMTSTTHFVDGRLRWLILDKIHFKLDQVIYFVNGLFFVFNTCIKCNNGQKNYTIIIIHLNVYTLYTFKCLNAEIQNLYLITSFHFLIFTADIYV